MNKLIELKVPDIGGHSQVDVIELFITQGQTVALDDPLLTLETDKATMDVPATEAGIVQDVRVKVGDKVSEGDVIACIEVGQDIATEPAMSSAVPVIPSSTPVPSSTPMDKREPASKPNSAACVMPSVRVSEATMEDQAFRKAHAGPSVRKLARELGVDLSQVKGTGRGGRIIDDDVKAFVKGVFANKVSGTIANGPSAQGGALDFLPWPVVDFAKFGPIDLQPLSRIKKISGANLTRNWVMIPHVTQFDEADITDLETFRKSAQQEVAEEGVKLTPLAFLIKACVAALKKYPQFNASLDGEHLVLKKYFHIGFAADTPNGLVVPVVRDADKKSLTDLAQEMSTLAKKARDGKLLPTDMQGGCFSISSLGGVGGTAFTPIINAPEVAILGVSKSMMKPVWNGDAFLPRLMLPLSLSYDHRVIDGAAAARFTGYLCQLLADIRRLML